jgi:opacity protein-like surface antigen
MKKVLIALAVLGLVAGVSNGASLKQGTQEIVIEGLFDPDTQFDQQIDLGIKYGQFIQDNVEVGVLAAYSDNDLLEEMGFGGFAEYNFDQGTELVPFVGAELAWVNVDGDDIESEDAVTLGGYVGVKYFLAENVAVSLDGKYTQASEDIYSEDGGDLEDKDMTINLGMRFYIP